MPHRSRGATATRNPSLGGVAAIAIITLVSLPAQSDVEKAKKSGQIEGTIVAPPDRLATVEISIAGLSIAARPDSAGKFALLYVPTGVHELIVDLCGDGWGRIPMEVRVGEREVTDVGEIVLAELLFCPAYSDPVCGIDGATYGNSCEAAKACVDVVALGECPEE